jgi:subtilisin family serine protease
VERALIGKVLNDDGSGTSEMIFDGMRWALAEGAHVVSMSLGFDFPGMVRTMSDHGWPVELATSSALEAYRGNLRMFDALMKLARMQEAGGFSSGPVFIAAAGNESRRQEDPQFEVAASLPAAAEDVISVAAVGRSNNGYIVAPFSNTFATIAAPGVDVLSARAGGGLAEMSGTSMACPHVAGLAALWHEALRGRMLAPSSRNIDAQLRAGAKANVFAPGTSQVHVGVGLASAPPNPA